MDPLHTIFFAALAIMLAINWLFALRTRSSLPLLYSGALLGVGGIVFISMLAEDGREMVALRSFAGILPDGDIRHRLTGLAGAWAAVCATFFWDHLMLLKIHAPRARFAVFSVGALIAFFGICMLIPGLPAVQLEAAQQLSSLGLLPTMAWTATRALRAGFRPALYSTIGVLFFLAMAAGHVALNQNWFASGVGPVHDQLLLFGFLGEFVWFLLSLAGRAAVLGDPRDREAERAGIREYQARYRRQQYARSTLHHVDTTRLQEHLDRLLIQERLYCDEDLTLERLAELCRVSRHELSEFLNQRKGVNFNRYINDYRVREASERLRSEPERTILDIAFASGFNSKTRFNTEFKRVTGQTPGEYRRGVGQ